LRRAISIHSVGIPVEIAMLHFRKFFILALADGHDAQMRKTVFGKLMKLAARWHHYTKHQLTLQGWSE
jgi:hypothetical protein